MFAKTNRMGKSGAALRILPLRNANIVDQRSFDRPALAAGGGEIAKQLTWLSFDP